MAWNLILKLRLSLSDLEQVEGVKSSQTVFRISLHSFEYHLPGFSCTNPVTFLNNSLCILKNFGAILIFYEREGSQLNAHFSTIARFLRLPHYCLYYVVESLFVTNFDASQKIDKGLFG